MKSIKALQTKVNQISKKLGGIDTPAKLRQARRMARQDKQVNGLLLEILDEALTNRWRNDISGSVERFLATARQA